MKIHYLWGNSLDKNSTNTICRIKVDKQFATTDRYKVTCGNCKRRILELRI